MVGLVCMKESGDRGKLCFCETDYCNGQDARNLPNHSITIMIMLVLAFLYSAKLSLINNTHVRNSTLNASSR